MRHLITHHAAGAGLLLMAGLVLTGCTQATNESAPVEASATPVPHPSPSPSTTEFIPASTAGPAQNVPVPEMPDAIHEPTQEGAEAALYYWWDVIDYALLTGDSQYLEVIADLEKCAICEFAISGAAEDYANGTWYHFEPQELNILDSQFDELSMQAQFMYAVTEKPGMVYYEGYPEEAHTTRETAEAFHWNTHLTFNDRKSSWFITDMSTEVDQ